MKRPTVHQLRASALRTLPFILLRRRKGLDPTAGEFSALWVSDKSGHSIRVCTRQCCVHSVCTMVAEELAHEAGWLEGDIAPNRDKREAAVLEWLRAANLRSEAAYSLLSSLLRIPMYCDTHKGGR